jgi:hypothetical protein
MATACLIDMQANHLLTDGTLCHQRVKPPPSYELDELNYPYGQVPHVRLLPLLGDHSTALCLKIDAIWVLGRSRESMAFHGSTKPLQADKPCKIRDLNRGRAAPQ